jgi:hypothetical protein
MLKIQWYFLVSASGARRMNGLPIAKAGPLLPGLHDKLLMLILLKRYRKYGFRDNECWKKAFFRPRYMKYYQSTPKLPFHYLTF